VALLALIWIPEPVKQKKKSFATYKFYIHFVVFKCLTSDFYESESVSESKLFFVFGSGQNLRILTDSDPDPD
jgi:hypothetical protein